VQATQITELELDLLLEAIFRKYKYDFRGYSRASVLRRVHSALTQLRVPSFGVLQDRVLHEPGFFLELLQFITVPVTEMFRDPIYFRALREEVVPYLKTYPSLKIWVAGCSTGEEAYSLAILLQEADLLDRSLIYATDINPRSLKRAQEGIYSAQVITKYAQNYQESGGTRTFADYYDAAYDAISLRPRLKDRLLFADHSLATDTVFSEVHLVSCRNVLIYFEKELQDRAIRLFHESLVPGGFLGVGEKESLRFSALVHEFESSSTLSRIYRKHSGRTARPPGPE
jgi:chemotaxis protein methyltransferase CheR